MDIIKAYFEEIKNHLSRWIRNPLYIGLLILFLISGGSSAYILFAYNSKPTIQTNLSSLPAVPTLIPTVTPMTLPTPTLSVASISATPTPDPTVDWQTFSSASEGYSIKYPTDWTATDSGQLEDQVPDYVIFNPDSVAAGAKTITISYSTRTSDELTAIYGSESAKITVDGIIGSQYNQMDSDGNQSWDAIIPLADNFLIFYAESQYSDTLKQMLSTFQISQ
ncbi:MAG TPA: hypothetical protein VMR41_02320 [Patescibacteria group bacterium]|nr:hypothetical protein [Patescibacteria group bacterium]